MKNKHINMDIQELPIMTFGKKYIGQPLTTVMADTKYVEWIKNQPDIEKKYPSIYNILVHQQLPNKSSKTPAHNLLQNKFLNSDVQFAVLKKLCPNTLEKRPIEHFMKLEKLFQNEKFIEYFGKHKIPEKTKNYLETLKTNVVFESDFNWDIQILSDPICIDLNLEYKKGYWYNNGTNNAYVNESVKEIIEDLLIGIDNGTNEKNRKKPSLSIEIVSVLSISIYAELKPTLGDDYPEVLRKMKSQFEMTVAKKEKSGRKYILMCCLIIGKFESRTTTEEQLIKIFGQTNIKVIFTRDLFEDDKITYTHSEIKSIEPESVISTLKSENSMLLQKLNEAEAKIMTLENQIASLKKTQKTQITSFFKPK
jgi:hypothetical protein